MLEAIIALIVMTILLTIKICLQIYFVKKHQKGA